MTEKMVEVAITATKTFNYNKVLKIPKSAYEAYLNAIETKARDRWFDSFAEKRARR